MFFLTRDSINSYDDHPKSCIGICSYWNPPLKEGQYYSFGRQSVSLQKYRFSVLLLSISEKRHWCKRRLIKRRCNVKRSIFHIYSFPRFLLSGKYAFFCFSNIHSICWLAQLKSFLWYEWDQKLQVAKNSDTFKFCASCSQAWKTSNTIHEYICNDWSYLSEIYCMDL